MAAKRAGRDGGGVAGASSCPPDCPIVCVRWSNVWHLTAKRHCSASCLETLPCPGLGPWAPLRDGMANSFHHSIFP